MGLCVSSKTHRTALKLSKALFLVRSRNIENFERNGLTHADLRSVLTSQTDLDAQAPQLLITFKGNNTDWRKKGIASGSAAVALACDGLPFERRADLCRALAGNLLYLTDELEARLEGDFGLPVDIHQYFPDRPKSENLKKGAVLFDDREVFIYLRR